MHACSLAWSSNPSLSSAGIATVLPQSARLEGGSAVSIAAGGRPRPPVFPPATLAIHRRPAAAATARWGQRHHQQDCPSAPVGSHRTLLECRPLKTLRERSASPDRGAGGGQLDRERGSGGRRA